MGEEAKTQREIVERLKAAGWVVREFSQPRAVTAQAAGLPDVLAIRQGRVLMIEVKSPTGKPRQSQVEFYAEVATHLSADVRYLMLNHPDQIDAWLQKTKIITEGSGVVSTKGVRGDIRACSRCGEDQFFSMSVMKTAQNVVSASVLCCRCCKMGPDAPNEGAAVIAWNRANQIHVEDAARTLRDMSAVREIWGIEFKEDFPAAAGKLWAIYQKYQGDNLRLSQENEELKRRAEDAERQLSHVWRSGRGD